MASPTKTAKSTAAKPAKTRVKKAANLAVATPGKAQADRLKKSGSAKPAAVMQSTPAAAENKPSKRATRAPAGRKPEIDPEQRRRHVELAAYFMAERHGFTPGREHEDWVAAEAERLCCSGMLIPCVDSQICPEMRSASRSQSQSASSASTQRTRRAPASSRAAGTSARQASTANLQRGAKLQPAGRCARSGGAPGIASMR